MDTARGESLMYVHFEALLSCWVKFECGGVMETITCRVSGKDTQVEATNVSVLNHLQRECTGNQRHGSLYTRLAAQPAGPPGGTGCDWWRPDRVSLAAARDKHTDPPL